MTGIAVYCPRAASGHAAAAPPSSATNSRRPMPDMGELRAGYEDRSRCAGCQSLAGWSLLTRSLIAPMLTLFKSAHIERLNRPVETFQSQLARRLKLEIAFD